MMNIETPVAQLVLDHSECARVFDQYRIDYCCKGARSLRAACEERGVDPGRVLGECESALRIDGPDTQDPRTLSTRALIDNVILGHHRYLRQTLPFLRKLAAKVARVHGGTESSLVDLERVFETLSAILGDHIDEEERDLFPALISGELDTRARMMLGVMRAEHEDLGMMLSVLRAIAADYVPPAWACNSYRTLLAELDHLESDTMRHVHVENYVLLPRFVSA